MSLQFFSGIENPPVRRLAQTWLRSIARFPVAHWWQQHPQNGCTKSVLEHQIIPGSRVVSYWPFPAAFIEFYGFPLLLELFHLLSPVCWLILAWKTCREVPYQPNLIFPFSFSASLIFYFMHLLLSQIYEGTTTNANKGRFQCNEADFR